MGLFPLIRGAGFGAIGFVAGASLAAGIRAAMGLEPWSDEPMLVIGYLFGLIGWLLGVGVWSTWAKEWMGLPTSHGPTAGWARYFQFTTGHKVVGIQYLVTFVVILMPAGFAAVLMRLELMDPGREILGADRYNTAMSLHGIMMIAVAVATIMVGFANFLRPLHIGAGDVAFPRVNALSYWMIPPVALLLLASPLLGGFDSGWTAYPPLSALNESGQLLFLLAFLIFGLSSIMGGLNQILALCRSGLGIYLSNPLPR